ncbi:MAG: DUF1707 domain-containing protein [Streptosporangiaceae bacterium]|jgi:hypothetical protein
MPAPRNPYQSWQNQPWARDFSSLFGGPSTDQHMRVSDAERQAVTDRLAEHFSSGRLDQEEFDERVSRAMSAKTRADLNGLFDDLPESGMPGFGQPGPGLPGTGAPAATGFPRRRRRHPVLLAALVILVALAAGHVIFPLLWIGFIVVIALAATGHLGHGRSHHRDHDHQ